MSDQSLPLNGRTGLVTGGGSGIGLASAAALAADGMSVVIMGRNAEKLDQAAATIKADAAEGATVLTFAGDVTNESQVAAAVEAARSITGQLDALVASAGDGTLGPIIATQHDEWNRVLDVTLGGVFLSFKHAGAAIAANPNGGAMVAISSVAANTTHRFMGPYCVAKAGVDMLVKVTADELGQAGVRVNAVNPGIIRTDLVAMIEPDDTIGQSYLRNMPAERFGEVADVAPAVRYLCGPESQFVTGATLPVDGGHHLRCGPDYYELAKGMYGDAADGNVS